MINPALKISITSSLYKTEKFLVAWKKNLINFAIEAKNIGLDFEINAIANNPSETELKILNELEKESWFNLYIVQREPLYASWNRGVQVAHAETITAWNVDDSRNAKAILDGLNLIATGSELVFFPFIYKRYFKIFGVNILVKRVVINPPEFEKEKFSQEMHCGPFYLFTKSLYEKVGPYDEAFRIAGDYDWCVRAAKLSNSLTKSKSIAGTFEKRDGTLSGGKNPLQEQENAQITKKFNLVK
jgi:hypothetical protein